MFTTLCDCKKGNDLKRHLAGLSEKRGLARTGGFHSACKFALCSVFFAVFFLLTAPVPGSAGEYRPSYLEGLENYMAKVEQHQLEVERMERKRVLERSVTHHTIKRGETLGEIARHYGVDVGELALWNRIENPHFILPGQKLDILLIEGTLHQAGKEETVQKIARTYGVEDKKIADFNLLEHPESIPEGEALVIPGGRIPVEDKEVIQAALFSPGLNRQIAARAPGEARGAPVFQWPLEGTITSRYGWRDGSFHYGLDIAAPHGSLVRASASGTVLEAGYRGSYGLVVTLAHPGGWSTLYAHNYKLLVQQGQQVTAGQPVAKVGASGRATGPHVHFEVIYHGNRKDPLNYLGRS